MKLFVGFQAVHIPVQAPREYTEKYLDTYTEGWSALRQQRYEGAIRAGVVPAGLPMEPMHTTEDWAALSPEQQAFEAKSMAVYAGMIESMDAQIGRLIDHLKETGRYDNTVFIFTSDNGASRPDTLAAAHRRSRRECFSFG